MKLDKGLVAGSSTLLILSLLEHGDLYGYQMIEELARRSNDVFQMRRGRCTRSCTHWKRESIYLPMSSRHPRAGCGSIIS